MLKVGITGNIASGKSQVEKILEKNYPVLDCDKAAHKILENSKEVLDFFGTNNRTEIASVVFNEPEKLKRLEEIIHPQIKIEIEKFFDKNSNEKFAFVSASQLFEAGFQDLFNKVIFIYANDEIRLKRLIERNNYDLEYAKLRISSQSAQEEKIQHCDFVIKNNSTLDELKQKVQKLIKSLELL